MSISLRWFQKDAIIATENAWEQGKNSVLTSVPTGGGKTIIFASLLEKKLKGKKGRGLILVHRDALLKQAEEKLKYVWTDASIGKVIAGSYQYDRQITVASVDTLCSRLDDFIKECNIYGPITHIITDEAHHAIASTWREIYSVLSQHFSPLLHLGVTATPLRTNKNEKLSDVFEDIVYSISIFELIKEGFLSTLKYLSIETNMNLSAVNCEKGDYKTSDLSKQIDKSNFNEEVVNGWSEKASKRKTICFAIDIPHVEQLVSLFNQAGAKAIGIHGKIPRVRQREIIDDFINGIYDVLVNCEILTEGFDCPAVDCVLMARPTSSLSLFVQMIGRGLRPHPGKADCLVVDFTDNGKKHKLITMQDLLSFYGMDKAHRHYKKNMQIDVENDEFIISPKTIPEMEVIEQFGDNIGSSRALGEMDIFDINKFAWHNLDGNWYVSARRNVTIAVCKDKSEKTVPYIINSEEKWVAPICDPVNYEFAMAIANVYLFDYGDRRLASDESKWRSHIPSPNQINSLTRAVNQTKMSINNIPFTRGDYSKVLTALYGSEYIHNQSNRISIEQATKQLKETVLAELYGNPKILPEGIKHVFTKKVIPDLELTLSGDVSNKIKNEVLEMISSLQGVKNGLFAAEFISKCFISVEEDTITFAQTDFPHYPLIKDGKAYNLLNDKINLVFRLFFRDKKFVIQGKTIRSSGGRYVQPL